MRSNVAIYDGEFKFAMDFLCISTSYLYTRWHFCYLDINQRHVFKKLFCENL